MSAQSLFKRSSDKTWTDIGAMFGHTGEWASSLARITEVEARFIKTKIDFGIGHVKGVSAAIKDEPTKEQKPETGLILHPELVSFMQNIAEQNVALQLQVDKLQAQVNWLLYSLGLQSLFAMSPSMLPWWKRVGKDMPGVEQQENN
jgi:hypothetical protein